MNRRQEGVSYQTLDLRPVLQTGLLPIERYDGDLERRVAAGLARIADTFAERAAQEAQFNGERDTMRDALAGAPTAATIDGGDVTGTASINGQAGHIPGAQGYDPPKGLRVTVPPTELSNAIDSASKTYGVDPGALRDIAYLESSYDPNARSDKSSAKGLFGFLDGTARQYNLRNPFDVGQSTDAAARLMRDNSALLEKTLGRKPTSGELYLAHQQGGDGARRLLANPDAKAVDVVGRDAVINNGGRDDMTAGQFAKLWTGKLDTASVRDRQKRGADLPIVIASKDETGRKFDPDMTGVKPELLDRFKTLQNAWGKSIPIASGFRDQTRNAEAGGVKGSQHLDGNALDLDVRDMPLNERKALIRTASAMGFSGIGVYANSLHLDMGDRRAWGPSTHSDSIPDWAKDAVAEHMAATAQSPQAEAYGRLPDNRDGPVKVTAVRTPMRITPGRQNTFTPTGRNTVYGRAYDVAGTRTWLQMAKMTIIDEQQQVYDKYKDDPATLDRAFSQLLEQHRREQNYFPEVAPEYELSFRQNAFELQQRARAEQEKRQKQQDQADYFDRLTSLEDQKSRLLAGADPRDPSSAGQLADMQATIDSHYDSAVSRGVMSPVAAAAAKRESRKGMVTDFYTRQAAGLKTAEIETLHAAMKRDYADGKLAGVTAEAWDAIDLGLSAARKARETEDGQARQNLAARGDDIAARILHGEPVQPSELARMRADAMTAPDGEAIIASTDARIRLAGALRSEPIGAVEARLNDILRRPDGRVSADDLDHARTQIDDIRKSLATDPVGVAERFGLVQAQPPIALDGLTDPAKLRDALSYRRGAALAAARHFGVPVKYFRPGEADQVAAQAMANPDAMVAFTLNVTNAFGKDTPAAMREISEAGPVMAHAVGLSIATGDASLARDVAQISTLKAKKEIAIKMPAPGDLAIKGNAYIAGALAGTPQMRDAALATAGLLYEKMAFEQGFDPAEIKTAGSLAEAAYFKALDRALGGQVLSGVETGGLGSVNDRPIVVPALMPKDRPETLIGALNAAQLKRLPPLGTINGIPIDAGQIRDGYLVSAGDGLYRVTLNDPDSEEPDYLVTPDGKPWLLDIRALEKIAGEAPAAHDIRRYPMPSEDQ